MYDFTIIGNNFREHTPRRLIEEAEKAGLTIQKILFRDLDFVIDDAGARVLHVGHNGHKGEELIPSRIAIMRLAGFPQRQFLVNWFNSRGGYVLNQEVYLKWGYLDKITQTFKMQQAGVPFVPTRIVSSDKRLGANSDFPYIMKHFLSSKGQDVLKITEEGQASELIPSKYKARKMLVQPFLPGGEDIRVVVLGGKAIGGMKKKAADGQFLTNFSAGGSVEAYDLAQDTEAKEIAERVAETFGAEYGGVDLMRDRSGKWKVLEINNNCQFEGFEKSTGINVAKTTIDYLQQKTSV
ncbi:MAG: hypothetical protein Q7S79_04215 [bacterium]|nr:hypothetical protein [bacterium]